MQQRRNFRKRDAVVACYIIFLYVMVGVLQLEVLEYRLNTEYNVEIRMQQLPFEQLRWVQNDPDTYNLRDLDLTSDTKAVEDMKGNRLLLFTSDWAVRWAETHNESLQLSEFGNI